MGEVFTVDEVETCGWSQRGGYDHPPEFCDEDALPGTDPPRCSAHLDWGAAADEWEPDYYDRD
jgi:hypothetical protein